MKVARFKAAYYSLRLEERMDEPRSIFLTNGLVTLKRANTVESFFKNW